MRVNSYRICSRCVMDTTDPKITFNDEGHCAHCIDYLNSGVNDRFRRKMAEEQLKRLIERIKRSGKGKDYDGIIGISGGVDSSYLAYIAKQFGLRLLAVHLDNGWNSETAVSNIKKITASLGIDYQSYVLNWDEFRDLQLAFLKASVPEAETPTDVAIPAALHYYAAEYDVKYILSGGNLATEGILPKSWHYDAKDLKYFKHIHRTFGSTRLSGFPTFGYKREMFYKLIKGIEIVYPLDLVPYERAAAIATLERSCEWKYYGGKHHESRYTRFVQSYLLYKKFGIDYRRPELSVRICLGGISRDQALEELKQIPYNPTSIAEEMRYVAKKLEISDEELQQIIDLPAKWFWDYPNDDKKLSLIYNTYRRIFKKSK
ncbi:MAG: N-acetyl sugar amidotransferase [Acidobacteria bacterium]|nr:N-acetyl sugar amidotransferase [Acidobacteriota bacterium]